MRHAGVGDLRVAQAPAVAFVLLIAEQFLDGHALPVKPADLRRAGAQAAHQEPRLVAFGRQVAHPADHDVLRNRGLL